MGCANMPVGKPLFVEDDFLKNVQVMLPLLLPSSRLPDSAMSELSKTAEAEGQVGVNVCFLSQHHTLSAHPPNPTPISSTVTSVTQIFCLRYHS